MDTEMSVWNVADFHFIFLFFGKKFKFTPPKYQVGDQNFSLIDLKLSLEVKTFYDTIKTKSYFCREKETYRDDWVTFNGWVTFKCQETLSNIALAMKASFTVDNRTQYTKLQVDNTVKNQIYPKKSKYISLNSLFDMIIQSNSPTFTETRIATNIRHEKRTDMQNNWHLQAFSTAGYYWRLELWNWIRMISLNHQIQIDQPVFKLK